MIAFGVSSPAYPARSVDEPMSSTRAETSSGRAENEHYSRKLLDTYRLRIAPSWSKCLGPIESKIITASPSTRENSFQTTSTDTQKK